jgi:hypothetical protein
MIRWSLLSRWILNDRLDVVSWQLPGYSDWLQIGVGSGRLSARQRFDFMRLDGSNFRVCHRMIELGPRGAPRMSVRWPCCVNRSLNGVFKTVAHCCAMTKAIFAAALALLAIAFWDDQYNNGTLTRVVQNMARELRHSL